MKQTGSQLGMMPLPAAPLSEATEQKDSSENLIYSLGT